MLTSAADFNGDLKVNGTDRSLLLSHFCASGCSSEDLKYDLDCDDDVDAADLAHLLGTYYSGPSLCTVPAICDCSGESMMMSSSLAGWGEESALASFGFGSWEGLAEWLATADEDSADAVCETLAILLQGG